jgi:alpha-glucosidase (family GH31 glycosyl hydrolase)
VTNWFEIVLGAREAEGIDFWWLDWQQGESWINIPLINPTIWLNYIFFTNPYHWKNNTVRFIFFFCGVTFQILYLKVRPLLLHRWGGLGNHRYQVGFSGDVIAVSDKLFSVLS